MKVSKLLFQARFSIILLLLGLQDLASAQQYVHKNGDDYRAAIMIQRKGAPPQYPPLRHGPAGRYNTPRRPWKQGDRITKQEVIQHLAKALINFNLE